MLKIGAVILAAGMSKRMGVPKLLLPLNNKPLFHHVLEVTNDQSLCPVVLITGYFSEEIRKQTKTFNKVKVVYNPNYNDGMASSLKLGITNVSGQVDAALILLADQPFVPPFVVQSLIKNYQLNKQEGKSIVRPAYQGVLGHPILFDATLFPEFALLSGDKGGKGIIKKHRHLVKIVSFDNPIWGRDIDTPEDFIKMNSYIE